VIEQDNEIQVRRLVDECVNANRPDLLADMVAPDVRIHPATPGGAPDIKGIEGLTTAFGRFHDAFPDLHITMDDVIAADHQVAARWTATGTHRGQLAGIPATGRAVRWSGIDVYRLDHGIVVEWWRNDDYAGLLEQLGRPPR
jgi:steroid delta-isomerase-like uncharacterized protein